jgi:hypothetical protein
MVNIEDIPGITIKEYLYLKKLSPKNVHIFINYYLDNIAKTTYLCETKAIGKEEDNQDWRKGQYSNKKNFFE